MTRRGLSIAEVLIVIIILGILASLAIPSLQRASAATVRTHCRSNLRQLARAATLFAIERDGRFPPGLLYGSDRHATNGDVRAWDWVRAADGRVRPGELWTYTDGGAERVVLQCPTADQTQTSWAGDPSTGYNYNVAFIAAESRVPTPADADKGAWDLVIEKPNLGGQTQLTLAQCHRSGTTALFGTSGRRGGLNKFMRSPVNVGAGYDTAYAGGQSFPDGRTNVAWVDGHVSSQHHQCKGQYWDDLPSWLTDSLDWPANGFLSEDAGSYDPR
jgi:prepilin-type N-terminal cleavage/methylation domain-containing protein/prepilin-type processing-associated H-X9-DG protein